MVGHHMMVDRRDILARLIPRLLGAPEGAAAAEEAADEAAEEAAESRLLEGIPLATVHGMMQEQTSSHLMEVWQQCIDLCFNAPALETGHGTEVLFDTGCVQAAVGHR